MSVFPSVHPSAWNNSAPTRRIFAKFELEVFENLPRKLKFLKSDRTKEYFSRTPVYIHNAILLNYF